MATDIEQYFSSAEEIIASMKQFTTEQINYFSSLGFAELTTKFRTVYNSFTTLGSFLTTLQSYCDTLAKATAIPTNTPTPTEESPHE